MLSRFAPRAPRGELFLALIGAYLAFGLVIDSWKPGVTIIAGLTAIQIACIFGVAVTVRVWKARRSRRGMPVMVRTE